MKGFVTRKTHVKYISTISYCFYVMAKVKNFVHTSHADAEEDVFDYDINFQGIIVLARLKCLLKSC